MNPDLEHLADLDDRQSAITLIRPSIYEETAYTPHEEVSQWDAVVDAWARSR